MYGSHNDTRVTSICIVNTQVSAVSLLFTDDVFVAKPLEQRFLWHQRWYVMNELFGATAVLKGDQQQQQTAKAVAPMTTATSRSHRRPTTPAAPAHSTRTALRVLCACLLRALSPYYRVVICLFVPVNFHIAVKQKKMEKTKTKT